MEKEHLLSRRNFLKTTGVLAGVFAIASQLPETLIREVSAEEANQLKQQAGVIEKRIISLGLCGGPLGSDAAEVYVKNGRILRITPLHYDSEYKPEDFNAWSVEARGKTFKPPMKSLLYPINSCAYKQRLYSPNRVKYPLKRVDFDHRAPPDKRNQQNRGRSGFVRITWEEALDIVVTELKRIKETYGPYAILNEADFHGESKTVHGRPGATTVLLQLFGGCTYQARNPDSWEGFYWGAKHVWGMDANVGLEEGINVFYDILKNGDMVLFMGCDPETTFGPFHGMMMSVQCHWLREAGIKSIYVCPDLNYGAAVHADKWIPVLPNTDVALHLAIAYVWITEGTYDKQYVETHTYGFDKFKAYVLGEEDGVPKTPKWAEQICGVPARTIKALARTWAKKKTSVAHMCGGPYMRGPYGTEPARTEIYLLAMQGIGKPGVHQLTSSFMKGWVMGLPKVHPTTMAGYRWPMLRPVEPLITKVLIPDAILNPPISWYGNTMCTTPVEDQFVKYEFPRPGYPEIHMIWTETPCWTACWNGGYKMIEALRSSKIEFILAQHPWLEDDCLFADVVLPVTTTFENDIDIMADDNPPYSAIFIQYRCVEPIGESKSDTEICEMIAERLGLLEQLTGGKTHEEWARIAFENSGVSEMISWEEFLKKQYFVVPTDPEWEKIKPGMQWYWELPEGKGLHTKSGKIEFFAQWLYENFGNDPERPPVAHYIPYGETWQESLFHPRSRDYPFILQSNHPRWRVHAEGDDITWLREIPTCKIRGPDGYLYEPVWIHPVDASKKGIKHGDIVMVYNERGAVLGAAYVTERITPGAVYMDHGARLDLISLSPLIDRSGEINLICPKKTNPKAPLMVVTAFLVDVVKVDLEELKAQYPEAFSRRLHPDVGPYYDTWVVG